jgi:hypothetical protein
VCRHRVICEVEFITRCQLDYSALNLAYAQLGALQVGEDGNVERQRGIDAADVIYHFQMGFVCAVREVQAKTLTPSLTSPQSLSYVLQAGPTVAMILVLCSSMKWITMALPKVQDKAALPC